MEFIIAGFITKYIFKAVRLYVRFVCKLAFIIIPFTLFAFACILFDDIFLELMLIYVWKRNIRGLTKDERKESLKALRRKFPMPVISHYRTFSLPKKSERKRTHRKARKLAYRSRVRLINMFRMQMKNDIKIGTKLYIINIYKAYNLYNSYGQM